VYDLLDCEHLAELPLVTDEATPSLLVLARGHPFDATESDRLATARPSLLLLERLVDALLPAAPLGSVPGLPEVPDEALTTREREVLALLGEGLLARSIAARLDVSERTVHKHLGSIYRKLDAHDRLLAVRRGESLGLIAPTYAREHATAGW
jgi:DNA-binding NarL/FixJ family response regulator